MLLFVHKSQIVESQSKCCISPIIFKEVTKEVFVESPESAEIVCMTLRLRQQLLCLLELLRLEKKRASRIQISQLLDERFSDGLRYHLLLL